MILVTPTVGPTVAGNSNAVALAIDPFIDVAAAQRRYRPYRR